jgi:zinc-binding alcohol dehydrogenase family protein
VLISSKSRPFDGHRISWSRRMWTVPANGTARWHVRQRIESPTAGSRTSGPPLEVPDVSLQLIDVPTSCHPPLSSSSRVEIEVGDVRVGSGYVDGERGALAVVDEQPLRVRSGVDQARKLGVRYSFLFMQANGGQLRELATSYDAGHLRQRIDDTFPFDQTPEDWPTSSEAAPTARSSSRSADFAARSLTAR